MKNPSSFDVSTSPNLIFFRFEVKKKKENFHKKSIFSQKMFKKRNFKRYMVFGIIRQKKFISLRLRYNPCGSGTIITAFFASSTEVRNITIWYDLPEKSRLI